MLALGSQGMRMGLLAVIARQLEQEVFMVAAPLTAARWMGFIFGAPALAAALTQALAGLWMERLGMRRIMLAANVFSWVGGALCLSVDATSQGVTALWLFFAGSIFLGLGGGCYETVNNTLVPTLYADDRERKMSQLHAWWPGGMLVGTLVGAALMAFELGWRFKFALSLTPILLLTALVPATVYPVMRLASIGKARNAGTLGGQAGEGENASGGGSANSAPGQGQAPGHGFGPGHDQSHGPKPDPRWAELLRPACLWLLFCMVLTATIELLPPPWFSVTLARTTEVTGSVYLILVFTTMFGLRQVLALFAHRIKPMTLLHLSAIFTLAGFLMMARATEAWQGVLAVLLWAAGCSAFWPTMMVLMSQRHARAGALGLGLLGTVGTLADFVAQPLFGHLYDRAKIAAAGGQEAFKALTERAAQAVQAGAEATEARPGVEAAQGLEAALATLAPAQLALEGVLRTAAHQAFAYAAWLPLVLIPALVVLGFFYRASSFTK